MKTKVSILFYAKSSKSNVHGHVPIYTRITVDGKRIEFSTGRFIDIAQWSLKDGKMKGSSREAASINEQLDVIRLGVRDAQIELTYTKIPLTASSLKSKLIGTAERARMLVPIFQDHNNRIKELIGREYAAGTLKCS